MPYHCGKSRLPRQKMDMERRSSVHQQLARLTLHKAIEIYHEILKGDETLFIIDDCSMTKELKLKTRKR